MQQTCFRDRMLSCTSLMLALHPSVSTVLCSHSACLHLPVEDRLTVVATLYMVATPIGNLDDITLRALKVLGSMDLVVCEDTRHSGRLLRHHGIQARLLSAHSHTEKQRATAVIGELRSGSDVAYITDAGTPGISDPGRTLVREVRDAGFKVTPIPGPSALGALISVSGFPGKAITFEGFLSPKAGRRRNRLSELLERREIFVLYESFNALII